MPSRKNINVFINIVDIITSGNIQIKNSLKNTSLWLKHVNYSLYRFLNKIKHT